MFLNPVRNLPVSGIIARPSRNQSGYPFTGLPTVARSGRILAFAMHAEVATWSQSSDFLEKVSRHTGIQSIGLRIAGCINWLREQSRGESKKLAWRYVWVSFVELM
jgi:hypothetical protein